MLPWWTWGASCPLSPSRRVPFPSLFLFWLAAVPGVSCSLWKLMRGHYLGGGVELMSSAERDPDDAPAVMQVAKILLGVSVWFPVVMFDRWGYLRNKKQQWKIERQNTNDNKRLCVWCGKVIVV